MDFGDEKDRRSGEGGSGIAGPVFRYSLGALGLRFARGCRGRRYLFDNYFGGPDSEARELVYEGMVISENGGRFS